MQTIGEQDVRRNRASAMPRRPSARCRPATCGPGPPPLAKRTCSPAPARARRPPASSLRILTGLAGSALPGPGSSIRAASVQIKGALPIGVVMTARLVVREKRPDQGIVVLDGQCTDPAGRVVATAVLEFSRRRRGSDASRGASARRPCRALSGSQADADRRRASLQRRCAGGRRGGCGGRTDRACSFRPRGRIRRSRTRRIWISRNIASWPRKAPKSWR